MKEYIVDLRPLGEIKKQIQDELGTDDEDDIDLSDFFADDGCIEQMKHMLLEHVGKIIKVRVTVMKD